MRTLHILFGILAGLILNVYGKDGEDLYLVPEKGEQLQYFASQKFGRQLSTLNSDANIAVVIDSESERVGIFNGDTSAGVVLDKKLQAGFYINTGAWTHMQMSLQDYVKEVNLSQIIEANSGDMFELASQTTDSTCGIFLNKAMEAVAPKWQQVVSLDQGIFSGVLKFFSFIMHPIKVVLRPLLDLATPVWNVFSGGLVALVNIFRWMGKLGAILLGGLKALIRGGVVFSLNLIIGALNGAQAFFIMLREIAKKLNLMTILKAVISAPIMLVNFITGLGGLMLKTVTGVFLMVSKLFAINLWKVAQFVKTLTDMVINFINGEPASAEIVTESVDPLLEISRQQTVQYGTTAEFEQYTSFLESVKGSGNFKIRGIPVAPFVKAVTKKTTSAKTTLIGLLEVVKPVVPFSVSLPTLLVNMVKSLNTTNGPYQVKKLIPSITISQDGVNNAGDLIKSLSNFDEYEDLFYLPAPTLLQKVPVIKEIYFELNDEALKHQNTTLDNLLESHHVEELVEFTTKALGLRR